MIRTIIIDDEAHAIEALKYELEKNCPEVEIIAELVDPKEGLKAINSLNPSLVLLDIEMPWMSGFDLLKAVEKINFDVIFITAYDQYAIRAFKFSAIDYLLKPVNGKELKESISKISRKAKRFNNDHFNYLINNLSQKKDEIERIVLPTSDGLEFVKIKQIIRCKSDSNYCSIFLKEGRQIFLAKTLKEIEALLIDHGFFRIHKSHLISENFISKYHYQDGGSIEMSDGSILPISRSRKAELLNKFKT